MLDVAAVPLSQYDISYLSGPKDKGCPSTIVLHHYRDTQQHLQRVYYYNPRIVIDYFTDSNNLKSRSDTF